MISVNLLSWDYLNPDFSDLKNTNFTGNVKFSIGDYEDRWCLRMTKSKQNKSAYEALIVELKDWIQYNIDSYERINQITLSEDEKESVLNDKFLRNLIMDLNNFLFSRWGKFEAINDNWKNKNEHPVYSGRFKLTVFQKSEVFNTKQTEVIAYTFFNENEYTNPEALLEKVNKYLLRFGARKLTLSNLLEELRKA